MRTLISVLFLCGPALLLGCSDSTIQPSPDLSGADGSADEGDDSDDDGDVSDDQPDGDDGGGDDPDGDDGGDDGGGDTGEPVEDGPSAFEVCFEEISGPEESGPDYDQFIPSIGSHCSGTDHQDIAGIERVVFLGDSVTVGTPPAADVDWYRNRLAEELATEFGLERPDWFWQNVNLFEGMTYVQDSGDFASCAEWGARTDDLMRDGDQVLNCFPEEQRGKTTLVVMTTGSNDLSNLTQGFIEGRSHEDMWAQTEEYVQLYRETIEWLVEPGRFPNGVHVVSANVYEFTDGTGDVTACPAAALAGFDTAVTDPALEEMVVWSMEQYMSVAVETNTDMLFMLETFCGHGFNYDDETGRCYRGPEAELWFDMTCIHPNELGHAVISDMVLDVVRE
jgi:hypothetical protein